MNKKIKTFDSANSKIGHLNIWGKRKDGLIKQFVNGNNVILDIYRENLANLAIDDDGIGFYEQVIPQDLHLDNGGATDNGDGSYTVLTPDETWRVEVGDPNYYTQAIDSKSIGTQSNIAVNTIHLDLASGNGLIFSRAMLTSVSGFTHAIALKCFEPITKNSSWELFFDWSILY